jgi:hypothetical protein
MKRRDFCRRAFGLAGVLAVTGSAGWPAGPAHAEERWVQTYRPGELWSASGAGAISFGPVRPFSYFRLEGEPVNGRHLVYNPRTQNIAWIDASVIGPSSPPPAGYLLRPRVLERLDVPARGVGSGGIWREPVEDESVRLGDVEHNQPLRIRAAVEGEDGDTWYQLDDGTYVWSGRARLPDPVPRRAGRWIDAGLNPPAIVTAYEAGKPVYSALALTGIGGWETPPGSYVIQRRVANERMRGPGWDVSNVLFTQYFTGEGHAIHYNYWSSNFGYAGSRGCLGMNYDDSLWFWNWATIGTPLEIHW